MHPVLTATAGALLAVTACSSSSTAVEATTSPVTATLASAPAPALASAPSDARIEDRGDGVTAITYVDVAGEPRTVLAEVRRPRRATRPVPVVVWSHGGSRGKRSTERVGDDWGRAFTSAGFAFVAIAHPGRDLASRTQLCEALGVEDCSTFHYLDWDRPADVDVVLDWLETAGAGRIDLTRAVYGGHSAGARSVLRLAGVDWPIPAERQPRPEPRFAAFLAASPPGATANGLTAESFDGVTGPVLVLSGAGDTTNGNVASDRRATMELTPDETFATVWVDDEVARHSTFDLDRDACRRSGGTEARCDEIARGLARMGTNAARYVLSGRTLDDLREAAAGRLPDGFEVG